MTCGRALPCVLTCGRAPPCVSNDYTMLLGFTYGRRDARVVRNRRGMGARRLLQAGLGDKTTGLGDNQRAQQATHANFRSNGVPCPFCQLGVAAGGGPTLV